MGPNTVWDGKYIFSYLYTDKGGRLVKLNGEQGSPQFGTVIREVTESGDDADDDCVLIDTNSEPVKKDLIALGVKATA